MDTQKKLEWFFSLRSVRFMQIFIVVAGDLLALSNLYPKHSMYISRPFLVWRDDEEEDDDEEDEIQSRGSCTTISN
ncbi:hypothetical protein KR009_004632 [Drosophila setifemur]|nr:hypothetical protein KR009_004632 [Drosophila setifemur]